MERPDVIERDRPQSPFGAHLGRGIGMALVEQRVERLLAQFLVVVPTQGRHDRIGQEVPVALEIGAVEPGGDQEVPKDLVERLQMIAVHLADDRGDLLVVLHADGGGPGIERRRQLLIGELGRAAAPDHQGGQRIQPVLAVGVVHRPGLDHHTQGHERRVRRLQSDADRVPLGVRDTTAPRRHDGARQGASSPARHPHHCPSSVRSTTVRFVSAK